MNAAPGIGRVVWYRSRTGKYTVPAMITATRESLNPEGVAAGYVPDLSSDEHVHLTVFTPGTPGLRGKAEDFVARADAPISENVAGCYQEWDVPLDGLSKGDAPTPDSEQEPGTWRWPVIR